MEFLKKHKYASILLLLLFGYLLLRAINVPFTTDEVATFFFYVQRGNFLPPFAHWDANNHILNSALSYLSYLAFGSSTLALRLPNLLLFIPFFIYVYKIGSKLSNNLLKWTFILSLCLSHNFIEFFALDRGYGMSMAFLLGAIWYLMEVLDKNRLRDYLLASIFISLSILSNMTLLNSAIIMISILFLLIIINFKDTKRTDSYKAIAYIFAFTIIPMVYILWVLFAFKNKGLLYYGTLDGFYELSVQSIIKLLSESESFLIPFFIFFYFLIVLLNGVYHGIKEKNLLVYLDSKYVFFLLFIGNFAAILIMANMLEINYPEDRTGIYFFPFFIGAILFALSEWSFQIKKNFLILLLLPFSFFPLHFIQKININYSTLWSELNIPDRYYTTVKEEADKNSYLPTIGGYRMRTMDWSYKNLMNGGSMNQLQSSHHPEYLSDYQIVVNKEEEDWMNYYTVLDYDDYSNLSLLKRIDSVSHTKLKSTSKDDQEATTKEYFNIYKGQVDSLIGETLLINLSFNLSSDAKPFVGRIVAGTKNKDKKMQMYEFVEFDYKRIQWKKESSTFKASLYLYSLPEDSDYLTVYLWNTEGEEYELKDIHISLSKVD